MEHTPHHEVTGQEESVEVPSSRAKRRTLGNRLRRKAILVVDDEPSVGEVLVEIFRQDACRVETAADGEEALAKLRHQSYDLIVCDVRMPRMNGLALYRAIEQQAPRLVCRVLFVTGDVLGPEIQEFQQQTAAPFLEKPFSVAEVRKVVRRILGAGERH